MYHQQEYSNRGNAYQAPSLMSQQVMQQRQTYSRSDVDRSTHTLARDQNMYTGTATGGQSDYQVYGRFYSEGTQRRHSSGTGMYADSNMDKQSSRENFTTGTTGRPTQSSSARKQPQGRSRQQNEMRQSQMSRQKPDRNMSVGMMQQSDRHDRNTETDSGLLGPGKVFYCKVCRIPMRNMNNFREHVRGRKHAKAKIDMRREMGAQFERLFPDDPEIRNDEVILPREQRPPSPPRSSRTVRNEPRRDVRDSRGTGGSSSASNKDSVSKAAQLLLTMGNLAKMSNPPTHERSRQEPAYSSRGRQEPAHSWRDPPQRESRDGKLATMGKMLDAVGVKDEKQLSQLVAAAVRNVSETKPSERGRDRDRQRSRSQQDTRQRDRNRDTSFRDRSPVRVRSPGVVRPGNKRKSDRRRRSTGRDSDRKRSRTSSGRGKSPQRSPKAKKEDPSSITVNLEELEVAQQIGAATGIQNMTILIPLVKVVKKLGPGGLEILTKWTTTFQAYISKVLTLDELARKLPKRLGDLIKDGTLKPELIQLFFGGNEQMVPNVAGGATGMPLMMGGPGFGMVAPEMMAAMGPGAMPLMSPDELQREERRKMREERRLEEQQKERRERSVERRRRERERRHREIRRKAQTLNRKRDEKKVDTKGKETKDSKAKDSKDGSKAKDDKKNEKPKEKSEDKSKDKSQAASKEKTKDDKEKSKDADKNEKKTNGQGEKKGTTSAHVARIKQRYNRQIKNQKRADYRKNIAKVKQFEKKPALKLDKTDIKTVVEQLKKAARKIDTSKK